MAKAVAMADDNNDGLQKLKGPFDRAGAFLSETRAEMKKVSSPSRAEVQSTTIVVIVTVFLFAAYFAIVDYAVGHSVGALLDKLTK